jgi:hypothetical protein
MTLDDQIKEAEMSGICSKKRDMRNTYKISVGRTDEKQLLGRH